MGVLLKFYGFVSKLEVLSAIIDMEKKSLENPFLKKFGILSSFPKNRYNQTNSAFPI